MLGSDFLWFRPGATTIRALKALNALSFTGVSSYRSNHALKVSYGYAQISDSFHANLG